MNNNDDDDDDDNDDDNNNNISIITIEYVCMYVMPLLLDAWCVRHQTFPIFSMIVSIYVNLR